MADDRRPMFGLGGSTKAKKPKRDEKPREPLRYKDDPEYYDDDDDSNKGKCSCRKEFFCTKEGILKLIEFFTALIAFLICALAYTKLSSGLMSRYGYFLFVGISCWIFTLFVISFNLCGCFNNWIAERLFRLFGWYITLLAYSAIYTFFWGVAGILLAFHYDKWSGNIGASFFGFVNLILFLIDTIMYFKTCRVYRKDIRKIRRGRYQEPNAI